MFVGTLLPTGFIRNEDKQETAVLHITSCNCFVYFSINTRVRPSASVKTVSDSYEICAEKINIGPNIFPDN
jgi:hypothetical protein